MKQREEAARQEEVCFICRKHRGIEAQPPGGYLIQGHGWRVCHAPASMGLAGTLLVELERHALGLADITPEEATALGPLLRQVSAALANVTGAARIYTLMTVEGTPHAHLWLVPRAADVTERGLTYLGLDLHCAEDAAVAMAEQLRLALDAVR